MSDAKIIYAVDAIGRQGVRLHTTYVRAWSERGAQQTGRYWLSILCRGVRFSTRVRVPSPEELGCTRLPT